MATAFDDLLTGGEGADLLQGLGGNDTLEGLTGNDLLYGGADDDSLLGDDGVDQLYGGSGNDNLYAGAGNDKLDGGSGNDSVDGGNGDDNLIGGAGDDTILGGEGKDGLNGGDGNDWIDSGMGGSTAHGGLGDDTIKFYAGSSFQDLIFGEDGNDTILDFFGANDQIFGTCAGGLLDGGAGDDLVVSFDFHSIPADSPDLLIYGGEGNDTLRGVSHTAMYGGNGDDVIALERYNLNQLGADTGWFKPVDGGSGYDIFFYDANVRDVGSEMPQTPLDWTKVSGFEEIIVRSFYGTRLLETVYLSDANVGETGTLAVRNAGEYGLAGDNYFATITMRMRRPFGALPDLDGSAITTGHLILTGGGRLIGGGLSDSIVGEGALAGNGGDDLISGSGRFYGGDGNDTLTGTETGSTFDGGTGDDSILAGTGNDTILGGDGNDSISAGPGTNTISGGLGDDTVSGGNGTDTVLYAGNMVDYTVTQDIDHLIVTGPEGTDILTGINFITFADQTYEVPIPGIIRIGSGDPDYIDGSDGPDSLAGGAGNDTLLGGNGNDTLLGGAGSDSLDGGSGVDTASYSDAASGVSVNLALGRATGGEAVPIFGVAAFGPRAFQALAVPGDRLTAIDNVTGSGFGDTLQGNGGANQLDGGDGDDSLVGGQGLDTLTGGAGADALFGGIGADSLDGGEGKDRLFGGAGDDIYVVTAIGDLLFETTTAFSGIDSGGTDTVQSAGTFNLDTTAGRRFIENLVLTGDANTQGIGNALNNRLTGNDGNNTLNGGLGHDILTGGLGSDRFVFSADLTPDTTDRIQDFDVAADRIALDDAVFLGLAAGKLAASALAASLTGDATDASDRILYETDTGKLYFDSDGTGAAQKLLFATLSASLPLTASDFVVF